MLAFLTAWPNPAVAKKTTIEIVLDASGSMNDEITGRPKIDIAKDVIKRVLETIPDEVRIGLRSYGPFGECQSRLLVRPGQGQVSRIIEKMEALEPSGATPTDRALRRALADLRTTDVGDALIILVSDGEETCGGNPCAAVREIRDSGVEATVHVVAFDVEASGRKQLQCIAAAGGGNYYDASTAESLRKALVSLVKSNWVEVVMDTTTLLATYALLAFLIERLTNGFALGLAFFGWWRIRFDVSAVTDPAKRSQNDRNRRVVLFLLGAVIAIIGATATDLNLLAELDIASVPPRAGEIVTGLLIASGADPIRELLQQRERRRDEPSQIQPLHVSGTLVIQQSGPDEGDAGRTDSTIAE